MLLERSLSLQRADIACYKRLSVPSTSFFRISMHSFSNNDRLYTFFTVSRPVWKKDVEITSTPSFHQAYLRRVDLFDLWECQMHLVTVCSSVFSLHRVALQIDSFQSRNSPEFSSKFFERGGSKFVVISLAHQVNTES